MTREEVQKVLRILKLSYPHSFKGYTDEETFALLNLWYDAFKDDDYMIVSNAVKSIIYSEVREYAPNIAQVKQTIRMLTKPKSMSEHEAWSLIVKATRNGIYNNVKEFEALPPVLQRIVGTPQQLYEWATMDSQQFNSVVASNVQRSYRMVADQEQRFEALPLEVKEVFRLTDNNGFKKLEMKDEL